MVFHGAVFHDSRATKFILREKKVTQTSENIWKYACNSRHRFRWNLKYQVAELEDGKGHAVVWMCHLYNQFSNVPWPTPQTLPGSVRSQGESPVTRWIFTLRVLKFNKYCFNVSCSRRCSPFCDVPASMRRIPKTEHINCSNDQQKTYIFHCIAKCRCNGAMDTSKTTICRNHKAKQNNHFIPNFPLKWSILVGSTFTKSQEHQK